MTDKKPLPVLEDVRGNLDLQITTEDYEYTHGDTTFRIPARTIFENRAVPVKWRGVKLDEWNLFPGAFLIHGYLYQHQGRPPPGSVQPAREFTRGQADRLLLDLLGTMDGWAVWATARINSGPRWGTEPVIKEAGPDALNPVHHQPVEGKHKTVRYLMHQLHEDYVFPAEDGHVITVPEGFLYDLASVPESVWSLITPRSLSHPAGLVHDFLYRFIGKPEIGAVEPPRTYNRKQVDQLFLEVMRRADVSKVRRQVAYRGVRMFGWAPWNRHKKRIAAGK